LVKLPGYKVAESVTPVQLCTESTCFKPETQKSLGQTARTQTATPTITPWPTAILKLEYIPTDIPSTPLPNVPPSAPQWLQEHGYFRVFESYHCQSVQPIYVNTFAASNVWSSTGQVTLLHGDFGWYAFGNRVDVPFLVDQGQYNIYSFCAQIIGMPDWTNIDGKGTNCQFCAVARKDPPPGVLDVNGVINKGGTYWVKLYDVWYGPASRNAQQPVPTTTPWPTPTPKPPEQFLTVDAAIRLNSNSFITWEAVNPKDLPTRANPKIWMNSYAGTYLIDFSKYLDKLGSGHAFWLDNCGTPVMKTYKGFQITRNDQLNVNWCILPGK
jgi:hypothetical protein